MESSIIWVISRAQPTHNCVMEISIKLGEKFHHLGYWQHTAYSNWVMSTIMATPSRRATTSMMLCLKVAPSRSSGITDTVAM